MEQLYDSMHAAQKPKSNLMCVTLHNESNMSTLSRWQGEEFLTICSEEDMAEKAQAIGVTIRHHQSKKVRRHPTVTTSIQCLFS